MRGNCNLLLIRNIIFFYLKAISILIFVVACQAGRKGRYDYGFNRYNHYDYGINRYNHYNEGLTKKQLSNMSNLWATHPLGWALYSYTSLHCHEQPSNPCLFLMVWPKWTWATEQPMSISNSLAQMDMSNQATHIYF